MKIYIVTPTEVFESVHMAPEKIETFLHYLSGWNGHRLAIPNFLGDGGILVVPENVAKQSVISVQAT